MSDAALAFSSTTKHSTITAATTEEIEGTEPIIDRPTTYLSSEPSKETTTPVVARTASPFSLFPPFGFVVEESDDRGRMAFDLPEEAAEDTANLTSMDAFFAENKESGESLGPPNPRSLVLEQSSSGTYHHPERPSETSEGSLALSSREDFVEDSSSGAVSAGSIPFGVSEGPADYSSHSVDAAGFPSRTSSSQRPSSTIHLTKNGDERSSGQSSLVLPPSFKGDFNRQLPQFSEGEPSRPLTQSREGTFSRGLLNPTEGLSTGPSIESRERYFSDSFAQPTEPHVRPFIQPTEGRSHLGFSEPGEGIPTKHLFAISEGSSGIVLPQQSEGYPSTRLDQPKDVDLSIELDQPKEGSSDIALDQPSRFTELLSQTNEEKPDRMSRTSSNRDTGPSIPFPNEEVGGFPQPREGHAGTGMPQPSEGNYHRMFQPSEGTVDVVTPEASEDHFNTQDSSVAEGSPTRQWPQPNDEYHQIGMLRPREWPSDSGLSDIDMLQPSEGQSNRRLLQPSEERTALGMPQPSEGQTSRNLPRISEGPSVGEKVLLSEGASDIVLSQSNEKATTTQLPQASSNDHSPRQVPVEIDKNSQSRSSKEDTSYFPGGKTEERTLSSEIGPFFQGQPMEGHSSERQSPASTSMGAIFGPAPFGSNSNDRQRSKQHDYGSPVSEGESSPRGKRESGEPTSTSPRDLPPLHKTSEKTRLLHEVLTPFDTAPAYNSGMNVHIWCFRC